MKPNEALRPVAVGEVWRRMVGKFLIRTVGEDVTRYLEPTQVGVGTKGGGEAVIHALRAWLARSKSHNDRAIAVTDLTNAFNCIDRSAFRAQARRVILSAVPWVDDCYDETSWLVFGNHKLKSIRGIQQGDPSGPTLFAIGIHEAVRKAAHRVNDRLPGNYTSLPSSSMMG